jgi:fimbrial chaperone protein
MSRTLRSILRALSVVAALAVCGAPGRASDLGVSPVALHLDRLNARTALTVSNRGAEPVVMQAEAVQWLRDGRVDADAPTGDLIVNPAVFTMQPGQSQLVRIGLRRAGQGERETTYRIVLREVPQPALPGEQRHGGQVRVLMAMRVPVYLAPATAVRALRWQAEQAGDGSVTATLRNDGNVHARVGSMQLRSARGEPVAGAQATVAVVFPGESRSFRVASAADAGAGPFSLDVTTDQGMQQVPVAPSRQ